MIKIDLIKKLPGIPAARIIKKEIVDERIISYPYALRICDYVLDSLGRPWRPAQGSLPCVEMLNRMDDVEFWADGVRYEGFLPSHPSMSFDIYQGQVAQLWSVTVLFLKDDE